MPEPHLDAVRRLLDARGQSRLAAALDHAVLHVWTETDEQLGLLDAYWAQWYALEIAELIVAPGVLAALEDDEAAWIGRSVDEALGGVDFWRIVEADDRSDAEDSPAEPPEPPPTVRRIAARPTAWQGMHFRSKSELHVATALDRANAAFWANARGRVGPATDSRENRESDFLVVWRGKLGILEVDGPSHEGKAAADHERDRLFRHHRIRVVERFDAERCYAMPDDVVAEFLRLLELNG